MIQEMEAQLDRLAPGLGRVPVEAGSSSSLLSCGAAAVLELLVFSNSVATIRHEQAKEHTECLRW